MALEQIKNCFVHLVEVAKPAPPGLRRYGYAIWCEAHNEEATEEHIRQHA